MSPQQDAMRVEPASLISSTRRDAVSYFRVADAVERCLHSVSSDPKRTIVRALIQDLRDTGLALIIRLKVYTGKLASADLKSQTLLAVAEKYLQEAYPDLDLSRDPAKEMLFSPHLVAETRRTIDDVILTAELEKVSAEELTDPDELARLECKLSALYPTLDLSVDPGLELLEGPWKEEVAREIDRLAC